MLITGLTLRPARVEKSGKKSYPEWGTPFRGQVAFEVSYKTTYQMADNSRRLGLMDIALATSCGEKTMNAVLTDSFILTLTVGFFIDGTYIEPGTNLFSTFISDEIEWR